MVNKISCYLHLIAVKKDCDAIKIRAAFNQNIQSNMLLNKLNKNPQILRICLFLFNKFISCIPNPYVNFKCYCK